ncbi:NXPE family member 4-like isoform X2 [Rhinolophus sinicus]|uniref:NXPE family member 4-like isoform X2 n=1 Tax=Rhinolophus sinicus TaxID=89399 RepID=UPI003D7BEB88
MLVYLHLSEKENYATQLRCSFITWTESDRHRAPSGHFSNPALSPRPPCHPGLPATKPSGFYHQEVWHSLSCSSRSFPTVDSILGCLAGHVVHMMGDSTLRQWWEYLRDKVPCEWP